MPPPPSGASDTGVGTCLRPQINHKVYTSEPGGKQAGSAYCFMLQGVSAGGV